MYVYEPFINYVIDTIREVSFIELCLIQVIGGVIITFFIVRYFRRKSSLKSKREQKKNDRIIQISTLEQKVQEVDLQFVSDVSNLTAKDIVIGLKKGKLQCKRVLSAFQYKALEAHNATNCLVHPFHRNDAEDLVAELEGKDESELLLYGLPISLKENFCAKRYDSTVGLSKWINKPFQEDSVLVKVLKHQGAIPFVVTNVPQTMLSWECSNPVFGTTRNPLDETRGPGGSSGGEAALIASKGSVLGFGGDIGGSIRIPAAMCGVVGLKPTQNRISSKGTFPICKGQTACTACFGPMARDVDTLALAMRALCVPKMWELDPTVPPLTFRDEVYRDKRPLKIGYFVTTSFLESAAAMQRGVMEAVEALESLGHSVVEWKIADDLFEEIFVTWATIMYGDQGNEYISQLEYDELDGSISMNVTALKVPIVIKKFFAFLLQPVFPMGSQFLRIACGCGSVSEWWDLETKKQKLISQVTALWKKNNLDALVCPGFACPAVPVGVAGKLSIASCYTAIFNLLNYPAGSLPVTKVTARDVRSMLNYQVKTPWHYYMKKASKGTEGLPVNVQVITLPWQEELCLRVMRDLEHALKEKEKITTHNNPTAE